MSRERITERVWGYEGYSSNLLEIHIGNLRKKIEEDPRHPRRLITVRGYGYKIMREVNG
jgi:DNA-binding response OmpR family regulator